MIARRGWPFAAMLALPLPLWLVVGPDATRASEAERLVAALQIGTGSRVADVGAGNGKWTETLARAVGPDGQVWATEVERAKVEKLQKRMRRERFAQVEVVLGDQLHSGLPPACCDAILLRLVYHHFTDPQAMRADLRRALRPGGRLVIADVPPQQGWNSLAGVPDRGGHGIGVEALIGELSADGFELLQRHDDWRGDETDYCLVFGVASTAG